MVIAKPGVEEKALTNLYKSCMQKLEYFYLILAIQSIIYNIYSMVLSQLRNFI